MTSREFGCGFTPSLTSEQIKVIYSHIELVKKQDGGSASGFVMWLEGLLDGVLVENDGDNGHNSMAISDITALIHCKLMGLFKKTSAVKTCYVWPAAKPPVVSPPLLDQEVGDFVRHV